MGRLAAVLIHAEYDSLPRYFNVPPSGATKAVELNTAALSDRQDWIFWRLNFVHIFSTGGVALLPCQMGVESRPDLESVL